LAKNNPFLSFYIGFFGFIYNGKVENLGIENCHIFRGGALVGTASREETLQSRVRMMLIMVQESLLLL